jgi:hypothetical protein
VLNISEMDCIIQDIPQLSREALRALQALFPRFEESAFRFDLIVPGMDRTIVWFLRPHDRRRYAVTLARNGYLRLRRYDSDDTRMTVFQSEHQKPEDFEDLADAFTRSESDWLGYEMESAVLLTTGN